MRFWDPAVVWLEGKSLGQQVMIAFVISMIFLAIGVWNAARLDGYSFPEEWKDNALRAGPLPDPVSIEGILQPDLPWGWGAWIASRSNSSGSFEKWPTCFT
jgi:hypothetical protein